MLPRRVRRLVEDLLLPWYDRAAESRKDEATEAIRQRSIAARIEVEKIVREDRIRTAYRAYGDGFHR